ncbi:Glycosyltransferase involved in cell wall bisynthesis [Chryseolinea serpens]|uniref:Glycosyltransferase involved in cell wall bisynthesis n=1 Tax=Chryseolinea serpens TaxID=947013 RepID=A0A1M5SBM4_9BACT|nr:glycosyltransferase family 2 protein [Chryseolinea serpens]SHH35879.1 Glycosyltransferase involved in cell wall bisynthesis [Chryseolinea serpens]
MELSVVVTLYNEEENIQPLLKAINSALVKYKYEVILVDDGSTDRTVAEVKQHADHRVKLVILNNNYGQTAAMASGIATATGDYIVTMDGDLQNDPTDIPFMLEKLKAEHWDIVAGNRKNRKDGALLRKIPSKIANRLIRNLTGVTIRDYGCTLKVFRKETAKHLGLYGELHRFIPILAVMEGGRIVDVDVKHHARQFGTSKYGLGRTFKVMSDLLLMVFFKKYFRRPIHFFGPLGIVCFMLGSAISLYLLVLKILGNDIWGRPILILGITLILAGIQFLTFGLIAELIMRVYYESQHKTTYTIREIFTKSEAFELETAH